jgi:hypothetical protein
MKLKKLVETGDYEYETKYLKAIGEDGTLDSRALRDTLVDLINEVEGKIKGFSYADTKVYYRSICEKAWNQVKEANTPETFSKSLEDNNDWMMLDRNYIKRMPTTYVHFWPPVIVAGRTAPSTTSVPGPNPQTMAQGYVSRLRASSNNMVKSMRSLSSSVTRITNPPPEPTYSPGRGYSGFGGGGGGCCCCCCACACACAGGGR